ncbi:hypothetical protein DSCO28_14740 [Desulfosarcina ovata subsp. sediminis]|uniref:Swt1-like HEPN domain-containing protein n=1 Tax=Desulfosarcina ovata subsp. sediminis TaxID=885957 RepID=A0A5K7ZFG6_9BACT|nr:Swt1 family HEPN domain-containing protein [Desulfosarcina ovata]BBO80908.1 hypothetical protein DSCO28_14740 [Desulfosarcina ovata subsp. sediminis]
MHNYFFISIRYKFEELLFTRAKCKPYHWDLGNIHKPKESLIGYLATNEGVRTLFRILKELLNHLNKEEGIDIDVLDSEDILSKIEKYTRPIGDIFKTAKYDTIKLFRSRSGQKGISQNTMTLLSIINKQFDEFNPLGLAEYLDHIDEEGTKEAKVLIGELLIQIQKFVINKLKEHFHSEENWWYEGIPENVRTACMERREKDKGQKNPEQYIDIIDYHTIAYKNWKGCFDEPFTFDKDGGKDKKLNWIKELNRIRNITHHETKWPASKDDVAFIRHIHKLVSERLVTPG